MKITLIILFLFPWLAIGQVGLEEVNQKFINEIHEEVICYTDRNLYLSGEDIWFSSIILINHELTEMELSKVLYIELVNQEANIVQKGKYLVQNNTCSGNIQIPAETLSGVYFLRVYTKFQRNKAAEDFTLIPISIVNTEFALPAPGTKTPGQSDNMPLPENINLKPSKTIHQHREKVTLDINWPSDAEGVFCVSVVRSGTAAEIGIETQQNNLNTKLKADRMDSVFQVPDIRGVSLSGYVSDKNTLQPMNDVTVYLSVFGENNLLQIAKTKDNGAFLFPLEDLEETADVFVSIDPGEFSNGELAISNDFSGILQKMPETSFLIDSTHSNLLTAMLISHETKKAFYLSDYRESQRATINNIPDNFDLSVTLDDFIELGTLEETFFEIIPAVAVKSNEHGKYLAVTNYQTLVTSRADLILLDNVAVFDVEELLKIPVSAIKSIHVMNKPYYLGDQLFASIVSLKTKTGNFGGFKFPPQSIFLEYLNLELAKTFRVSDYSTDSLRQNTLPDFRTTLYWTPLTKVEQSATSLSFYTTDDRGTFEIIVRGITNKGEKLFGKTVIEIN